MIQKILKHTSDESVVVLVLRDDLMESLAQFIHGLNGNSNPFTPESAVTTQDFGSVVEVIRRTAAAGDKMTDGRQKRIKEVLGTIRANDLFGPNYGAASWDLFTPADPLKLTKLPNGGYRQVPNERHNPAFLAYLLTMPGEDASSLGEQRKAKRQDGIEVDPTWSVDTIWAMIREGSRSGRPMSEAQVAMISKVLPGSFEVLFPHAKDGSLQLFMTLLTKRRKKADDSGWEDNPNFRQDAFEFVTEKVKEIQ